MPFLHDLVLILTLGLLEGLLSIDNALVLALLVRGLPEDQRRKALTYGLAGAVVFRLIALWLVTSLMKWTWVKWAGGGYLVWIAVKHLFAHAKKNDAPEAKTAPKSFWRTVLVVELTDIAFAVDSILAAVAMSNRFWIVFIGGFIGIVMIRYASSIFTRLLNRFPGFEVSAYLMILVIGCKLLVDAMHIEGIDFHSTGSLAFWAFWGLLLACLASGFRKTRPNP